AKLMCVGRDLGAVWRLSLTRRRETEQARHGAHLFPFRNLSGDRRIDGLAPFRDRRADLNHTGLQPLRYLALEVDGQQPVLHVSTPDFDMVGELEAALESARCDAAVEERALLIRFFLLASDRESVLLHLDLDVFLAEPGDRHGDAVLILGKA